MWNRSELKSKTKNVMKRSYWVMFVVSLVAMLLCGDLFNSVKDVTVDLNTPATNFAYEIPTIAVPTVVGILASIVAIGAILGFFYRVFVANVIEVGKSRYFLNNTKEKAEFFTLFSGFGSNYLNVVKVMLIRDFKLVLWTLLLIVPGVIKSYEYQVIPYLLAEDSSMSSSEAFYNSKQMTQGHKFSMFVLDLSFVGWYILGILLFGIGTLFVYPYKNGVAAELYLELKYLQNNNM